MAGCQRLELLFCQYQSLAKLSLNLENLSVWPDLGVQDRPSFQQHLCSLPISATLASLLLQRAGLLSGCTDV